jgi:uncharacterized protein
MIRRHPLLTFLLVACGYSWSLWFLMIASARGWLPFRFPTSPLGSFGPLLAAWLLARPSGLHPSARSFFRTTLRAPTRPRWLVVALLGPLILTAVAVLAHRLVTGALPPLAGLDRAYLLPLVFLLILIVGGPVGEEFGWRGYVLPHLLRDRHPLTASLILSSLWVTWHLPLFWLEGAAQEGSSLLAFALTVTAASVLFTWMYLHTAPGLVPVLLLHTSINAWSFLLPTVLPGVDASKSFGIAFVGAFVVAAVVVVVLDPRMRGARAKEP